MVVVWRGCCVVMLKCRAVFVRISKGTLFNLNIQTKHLLAATNTHPEHTHARVLNTHQHTHSTQTTLCKHHNTKHQHASHTNTHNICVSLCTSWLLPSLNVRCNSDSNAIYRPTAVLSICQFSDASLCRACRCCSEQPPTCPYVPPALCGFLIQKTTLPRSAESRACASPLLMLRCGLKKIRSRFPHAVDPECPVCVRCRILSQRFVCRLRFLT